MIFRIYALLFVAILVFAVWFQQSYMQIYSSEFEAQLNSEKFQSQIMHIQPLSGFQYKQGRLKSVVRAQQGRYFSNGRLLLIGDVEFDDYGDETRQKLSLRSSKAQAQIQTLQEGATFFDSEKKLETVELPNAVVIKAGEDLIRTKDVEVNLLYSELETQENVVVEGPGRRLQGKGLVYDLENSELTLGGKVKGVLTPRKRDVPAGSEEDSEE